MLERRVPSEWQRQTFLEPREVLVKFAEFERRIENKEYPENVRSLRTRPLRPAHYLRQAALFCYGMSHTARLNVEFALLEDRDIDCITRWREGDAWHYTPVQLKELVPAHVNATSEVANELAKLAKYKDAWDVVVALYVNRELHVDLPISVPSGLRISELWIYGATTPDRSQWMLYGDALGRPVRYDYAYPS